jgi:hypothetical protein
MPAGPGDLPPAGGCSPSAAAGLPSASAVQPGSSGTTAPPGRESAQLCRTRPAVAARHTGQTSPSQPPPHLSSTPANGEDDHDALIHRPLWMPRRGKTLEARIVFAILMGNTMCPVKRIRGPSEDTAKGTTRVRIAAKSAEPAIRRGSFLAQRAPRCTKASPTRDFSHPLLPRTGLGCRAASPRRCAYAFRTARLCRGSGRR